MTFTYNLASPNDITRVRFHLGDTDEGAAIFSDEEISFAVSEAGGWQGGVILCIRSILGRLAAEPDMQADWLRVDWRRSTENWQRLLNEKSQEFGVGRARASAGGQHVHRVDGLQKSPPDWERERPE